MSIQRPLSRRRFIHVFASTVGVALMPRFAHASASRSFTWSGEVLGGYASMKLFGEQRKDAERVCKLCLNEIDRLENIFSLYRASSAIRRLNKEGELRTPPWELVKVIDESVRLSKLSQGAFDVTLQPLWQYLYYAQVGTVDPKRVKYLQSLIGYKMLEFNEQKITFEKPGMMITLNGIAQGFITDRVREVFRNQGYENVFLELGETYGMGRHIENRPWQIGIKNPDDETSILEVVELENRAIATSGGYGTRFDNGTVLHHLLHPKTARSGIRFKSLSVVHENAMLADGLSTTLSLLDLKQQAEVLKHFPGSTTYCLDMDDNVQQLTV